VSKFRGFSQFGLLAGIGTMIIGFTLFCWSPAVLMLIGRRSPDLVARLIGSTPPPRSMNQGGELRIPRPKLVLTIAVLVVAVLCAFAIPWKTPDFPPSNAQVGVLRSAFAKSPTLWQRMQSGVRFNYNTRALLPEDETSVRLQDEVADRFHISADPVAVFARDDQEAREVYDELERRRAQPGSTIEQIVSEYTFVPPPERAAENAKVLEQWEKELSDIDIKALPPDVQEQAGFFKEILAARPYTVHDIPKLYQDQFRWLPETKPENRGILTFIYPKVDLRDGQLMLKFADEVREVQTSVALRHGAGSPLLFARLARMVLRDGYLTVILTTIWILFMHFLDFRSVKLALASVIPLGVGLVMMLGLMSLLNQQLNFMNIIILPILLGFGVSHGLYLLHRFLEGTSPVVALRSVGAAVAASTLTAIAGFGSLLAAAHYGLKSMGFVACLGLTTTLIVSFTVLAAVLQLIYDGRMKSAPSDAHHRSAA
jgi:predicted RND superfamily exporter protein